MLKSLYLIPSYLFRIISENSQDFLKICARLSPYSQFTTEQKTRGAANKPDVQIDTEGIEKKEWL